MGSTVRGTKRSSEKAGNSSKRVKVSESKTKAVVSESDSESDASSDSSEDELDFSSESEDELESDDEVKVNDLEDQDQKMGDDNPQEYNEGAEQGGSKHPAQTAEEKREARAKQKKEQQERKLQRKSGVEVQHIKSLWERLRVKNPPVPKEVRDKLSDEIWSLSRDVIADLVLKHDASRVVQTLVKYSSKERREEITRSLKGHFYDLATSSYGKYLLVKLLHYGTKTSRDLILDELHGKLRKLMRHREGAYVVEDLYVLYSTSEQKKQMIREFWGAEYAVFKETGAGKSIVEVCEETVEKRTLIQRNLFGTISASVEKGSTGFQILHAAMRDYVQIMKDEETRELIELLNEQIAELIHTPEGCEVACTLVAKSTAKEKKLIMKYLKEHAINLITNEYGNLVVTTLFLTADDTRNISKPFQQEFNSRFPELIVDKYARRPFLYLLNGLDGRYFSPIIKKELEKYIEFSKDTSKKPQPQRKEEFLSYFSPMFYDWIINDVHALLKENMGSQFVVDVFLNNAPVEDEKREKALAAVRDAFQGDIEDEEHLISKPFSVRLLKSLIQGGKWDAKNKKLVKLDISGIGREFGEKFYEEVIGDNLEKWISNKSLSFVVVSLFESLDKDSRFFRDLKKLKKTVKAASADENKGAQLLQKLAGF